MVILEHIYLADKSISLLLQKKSENLNAQEVILGNDKIERLVVNLRHRKVKSPDILLPKGRFKMLSEFKPAFTQQRENLKSSLQDGSIPIDNSILPHSYLGNMTKTDWLYFIIHHAQRHLEQIKERV